MNRVLVTGATGFVGRQCLAPLSKDGWEIHATSLKGSVVDAPASVNWHEIDLLNADRVAGLLAEVRPTHLIHFAWHAVPGDYWTSQENFRWVQASLVLFRVFASCGGRRAVVAGSCAEYDWRYGYCSETVTPVSPATVYGACKQALAVMLTAMGRQTGVSIASGRLFFVYGPHEHPQRFVASLVRSLLSGIPAPLSHGRQVRDFLYTCDAAEAFVALLNSNAVGPVNIASGQPVALKDVAHLVATKLNRRDLVELGALPTSESEPPVLVADTTRLRHEVGWSPSHDLDRGLEETIEWWRHHLDKPL